MELLREVKHSAVLCRALAEWSAGARTTSFRRWLEGRPMTVEAADWLYGATYCVYEKRHPETGALFWVGVCPAKNLPAQKGIVEAFTAGLRKKAMELLIAGGKFEFKVLAEGLRFRDARKRRNEIAQAWKER